MAPTTLSRKRKVVDSPTSSDTEERPSKCPSIFEPVAAEELLDRVLASVEDDEQRGYKKFLEKHGTAKVKSVLLGGVRQPVKAVHASRAYWDVKSLLSLDGNLKSRKPGIYMDVVTEPEDPEFQREYIGQAVDLKARIDEHKRKMKSGSSLHYRIANSRSATFVILIELDEMDDLELWLNIAEMWMALLWQTLPRPTLEQYLFPKELRESEVALNVASPLNQAHQDKAKQESSKLKNSTDPLVQKYWQEVIVPQNQANFAVGRAANAANEFKGVIEARRQQSKAINLKRGPSSPSEAAIMVKCGKCNDQRTVKKDPAPEYEISSDKYIICGQRCDFCPKKANGSKAQQPFEPVNKKVPTIRERQLTRNKT